MEDIAPARGYAEDFDADWFLENYVKGIKHQVELGGITPFAVDFLQEIFATGKYNGSKLLDIGTGPTIHTIISASRHVKEIHLSDIGARNREILQKWRDGESYLEDIFEYISKKEKDGTCLEDRINEVRNKVTQIYEIDLKLEVPLIGSDGVYDLVIASLVLCAVAKSKEEYTQTLRKVITMLKPGGHFVVIGVLDSTFYIVGNKKFTNPIIDRGDMKNIFTAEGLKIIEWKETEPGKYIPDHVEKGFADEQGLFGMIAQTPEKK